VFKSLNEEREKRRTKNGNVNGKEGAEKPEMIKADQAFDYVLMSGICPLSLVVLVGLHLGVL
jgi:hypothetical protein